MSWALIANSVAAQSTTFTLSRQARHVHLAAAFGCRSLCFCLRSGADGYIFFPVPRCNDIAGEAMPRDTWAQCVCRAQTAAQRGLIKSGASYASHRSLPQILAAAAGKLTLAAGQREERTANQRCACKHDKWLIRACAKASIRSLYLARCSTACTCYCGIYDRIGVCYRSQSVAVASNRVKNEGCCICRCRGLRRRICAVGNLRIR